VQPREGGGFADAAIFQGASFFRAIARGQTLGATARGLTIRTGDPRGEEFPAFKSVWIEKPTAAGNALVLYALLDSESVTGAYRFTLRPGEATIIDTEATLIPRVQIDHFGLGAMSAAYLFGPIDRRRTDDVRPAVCEVNGLQMLTGHDEWIWRPVSNRETLQVSAFVDDNPKGFGFLMRTATSILTRMTIRSGRRGPRSGSSPSVTGARAVFSSWKFRLNRRSTATSSLIGGRLSL
jgi:glucans biosynthesis protein